VQTNHLQELIPNLPVKFGYELISWHAEAIAFNFIVKFKTSGEPTESEVLFTRIPIH